MKRFTLANMGGEWMEGGKQRVKGNVAELMQLEKKLPRQMEDGGYFPLSTLIFLPFLFSVPFGYHYIRCFIILFS